MEREKASQLFYSIRLRGSTRVSRIGTVHGVYLKYVGLSALSYASFAFLMKRENGDSLSLTELLSTGSNMQIFSALTMGYSTILNGVIAVLFKLEVGMGMVGKNRKTGKIPTWSYILLFPFHVPTLLYTHMHTMHSTYKVKRDGKFVQEKVPTASEVQPGWWVGGCYAHELKKDWAGVVDLTVEFPESCIKRTRGYISLPTWDGVPCSPAQLEEAATFAVNAAQQGGDVLVHCAHGRGRSTTVMCACLVKAGLFDTWKEAFEKGIQPQRSVCKLNKRMRENLTAWQEHYVDGEPKKKGQ